MIFDNVDELISNAPVGEERPTYQPSTSRGGYVIKGESPDSPPTKKIKIIDLEHEEEIEMVDLE